MSSATIESHEDDSVTLTAGSITARISGDSWTDANEAAHVLAGLVIKTYEAVEIRTQLAAMREQLRDLAVLLDSAERHMVRITTYADFVRASTSAQNGEKP